MLKLPNGGEYFESCSGNKYWTLNGKLHREDGPAAEYFDGGKYWFINGERHREDGPAIEWTDGDKEWWLNNKRISQEKFNTLMRLKAFW